MRTYGGTEQSDAAEAPLLGWCPIEHRQQTPRDCGHAVGRPRYRCFETLEFHMRAYTPLTDWQRYLAKGYLERIETYGVPSSQMRQRPRYLGWCPIEHRQQTPRDCGHGCGRPVSLFRNPRISYEGLHNHLTPVLLLRQEMGRTGIYSRYVVICLRGEFGGAMGEVGEVLAGDGELRGPIRPLYI